MTDTLSHLLCRGLIKAGIDALYCLPGQGVLNAAAGPVVVEMLVDKIYLSPWTQFFLPTVRGEPQVPMLEVPD